MPRRLLAYFEPDDLSGLVCWLKADTLALTDGDAVASWTDDSGNSNTPTQATAANKPTFIDNALNGKAVIRFDGNDGLVMPTEGNFDLATPTIFLVARRTSGSAAMGKSTTGSSGADRRKMFIGIGSSSIAYTSGNDSAGINVTATTANWNMFGVATVSNSQHSMYLNGTQTNSTVTLSDSTTNNAAFIIGSNFSVGTEPFNGDIAEIIIYNRPLAGSEVVGLQNYLTATYNLNVISALGGSPRTAVSGRKLLPTVVTRSFDGVDDNVSIGTLGNFGLSLNTDGLVAFCFRLRTTSTSTKNIFSSSNGSTDTSLLIGINRDSAGSVAANKMGVFIRDDDNEFQNVGTTSTFSLADGLFHKYVVQRVSRYVWQIWQDGVSLGMTNPSASGNLAAGFVNFINPMLIGNTALVDMSDVAIYQRSLSSAEIAGYQSGTFPSNAFRIFTLTDGDLNVAVDTSDNHVNGTITGALLLAPRRLAGSGAAP